MCTCSLIASQELRRVNRPSLVGVPEPAASAAVIELLSISGDGRFLAYTTRRGTRGPERRVRRCCLVTTSPQAHGWWSGIQTPILLRSR